MPYIIGHRIGVLAWTEDQSAHSLSLWNYMPIDIKDQVLNTSSCWFGSVRCATGVLYREMFSFVLETHTKVHRGQCYNVYNLP